ncbi:MAG: hypothetical protein EHJ95_03945 [Methanobacteriota archaeon]|nr:MAG: hypothetical protein EHJ95_03945 [Euryarchaeota archaeon]
MRGNDYSPAAVAIVLNTEAENIPKEIERLVRAGIESGAALSGTVQTENIGFEKLFCDIVANTNIRYLVLGGPESAGHLTGEAMKALFKNGVDQRHRIIGTESPHPSLYNIPLEFIEWFRKQLTLVDCQFQTDDVIRQAVWSCYQEVPVEFLGYSLYDSGAYPDPPLSGRITWRVTQPWVEPLDEKERVANQKVLDLIERLKAKSKERRRDQRET